jgi:hypothetical protein
MKYMEIDENRAFCRPWCQILGAGAVAQNTTAMT